METDDPKALAERFGAHNYHSLPVVLSRGSGVHVWDTEGKRYFDFLSAFSALNAGHAHPHIVQALHEQSARLGLTSRAFHNDVLGECSRHITRYFGYDKMLTMNTGGEAVETAVKLARKWGYEQKGVLEGEARVVVCAGNYHGATIALISASTDPETREGFGPWSPGFDIVPYDDLAALERVLEDPRTVAFIVEPIQGEAGMVLPSPGYLRSAYAACRAHDVLFIADEVQTGMGRTGSKVACDHDGVRPDLLVLGKALGGGVFPVSAVLADDRIMLAIKRSAQHGTTYGSSPVGCRVAKAAVEVLEQEDLCANAERMGRYFRRRMHELAAAIPCIEEVRGRGLLSAVVLRPFTDGRTAWDVCLRLKDHGLLAKPTHGDIIRLTPPLIITERQMEEAVVIIGRTLQDFA